MRNKPTISLDCLRKNGRREITKIPTRSLSEARELARHVLRIGNGLYSQVDICSEDGNIETVHAVPMNPSEVLLVEDNAGDALLVGQAIAECPTPVHLRIARDGEQALKMLHEPGFIPDLIILDLNIPGISGYGVMAAYPMEKAPVVVFTSSENQADVDRAFSLGARDFVRKPTDLDDYKNAVTGMVEKWAGHDSADITMVPL
jgi:CheY-like chemotaxis protein